MGGCRRRDFGARRSRQRQRRQMVYDDTVVQCATETTAMERRAAADRAGSDHEVVLAIDQVSRVRNLSAFQRSGGSIRIATILLDAFRGAHERPLANHDAVVDETQ